MDAYQYFSNRKSTIKKKYDALNDFFSNGLKATQVAKKYGYTKHSFYSLIRDFKNHLRKKSDTDYFFKKQNVGRRPLQKDNSLDSSIIELRKQNFSTEQIVSILNSKNNSLTYNYVYKLLKNEGFARLFRRKKEEKELLNLPNKITASKSRTINLSNEIIQSQSAGIFIFYPILKKYRIDVLINNSEYPETKTIPKMHSLLTFLALKLSSIKRYSHDDLWCMDRGLGLFAGLNVLPKSAWLSSYSSRITREMNMNFLRDMHKIWKENNLLSDTSNLDFTTIPYWGDGSHLENNWSGKRNKSLSSMLSVLAQDPDSGIIDYGDTDIMHKNESAVVLEYLDFYKKSSSGNIDLKYLVFDSKFTNYKNLAILDDENIKFLTIRRRGKNIVDRINNIPKKNWKVIRIEASGLKKRSLKVCEEITNLKGYSTDKEKEKK